MVLEISGNTGFWVFSKCRPMVREFKGTRTSWKKTSATREEKLCRLCGSHEETQEHLTKCTEIAPVWEHFYDLVGDTTGVRFTPTPDHILFGLDKELKPLKGALMDLHALCWKMIIWKFTAQELDPEKPPFHAITVYKLAMQAMATALKAHHGASLRPHFDTNYF